MRKRIPYITIEGIKGSGKSSLTEQLQQFLERDGFKVARLNTTQTVQGYCLVELLFHYFPVLGRLDKFNEWLYACRAKRHSQSLPADCDLILGDRSVLTSYVTRWYKWTDPGNCIHRVDKLEAEVPVPDHIIWLYCEPNKALTRIQQRPPRNYGLQDEIPERLLQAHQAYYAIFSSCKVQRLNKSRWAIVNGSLEFTEVTRQVHQYIMREVLKK